MNLSIWKRVLSAPFGAALGSCILLQGILMAVTSPLLPIVLSQHIGMDKPQIAAYFLLRTLVGIVVTLSSGYLSDGIIARHKLVIVGGTVASIGTLLIAAARLPLHAYTAVVLSVGLAVLFPQLFAAARSGIVAGWTREEQTMGITALRTLFSFGYIIGTAVASVLAQTNVQGAYYLFAAAMFALTLYAASVLYRVETHLAGQSVHTSEAVPNQAPIAPVVPLPFYAMIAPLLSVIVLVGADSTRQTYLALVMFQLYDNASIAPLMFGTTAAVELITMSLMGYLSSKIGERYTIALGTLFGTLYFATLSFSQSLPLLYLANVFYAVFVAVLYGVAMAYIQGLMEHRVGLGGSLYISLTNAGQLVGILSPLMITGYTQSIFILPALLCLGGATLLLIGDRTAQIQRRLINVKAAPHV